MRLIIAGTRTFRHDYHTTIASTLLGEITDNILPPITILSGAAPGIDKIGELLAKEWGLGLELYPADWDAHRNAAGPIRNTIMVNTAEALLLIWDGESRGSADIKRKAEKAGLRVYEVILRGFPIQPPQVGREETS